MSQFGEYLTTMTFDVTEPLEIYYLHADAAAAAVTDALYKKSVVQRNSTNVNEKER